MTDEQQPPQPPTRLSALDATFLHVEDHVSHMHIGSISIMEGPPPRTGELAASVAPKLAAIPKYRQVVRRVPFDLGRPVWIDDPHFNIDYHVRQTALPAPGGVDELRRLIGRVMAQQLDRTKPLWEMWVVEGLDEGRWALLSKVHHAMVDGVSGAELLAVVLDVTPDPPPPAPAEPWLPAPVPSGAQLVGQSLSELVRSPYEQFRAVRASTRVPRRVLGEVGAVAKGAVSILGATRPGPHVSLNGPLGPHRTYAWACTTVADIKEVRNRLGGTFNDVVLAAITGGFRQLLLSRGEPVEHPVTSLVPVSVRARNDRGVAVGDGTQENKVAAMFAELPVNVIEPVERLHAVAAQMADLKESKQALAAEAITSAGGFAPPMLLGLGMRIAAKAPQRSVNTVTTNVPGPQLPLYVLGRKMLEIYPYVPLAGQVRVGVAIFSYNGQVAFGVTGDYETAPDVQVLCDGIEQSMAAMLAEPAAVPTS